MHYAKLEKSGRLQRVKKALELGAKTTRELILFIISGLQITKGVYLYTLE